MLKIFLELKGQYIKTEMEYPFNFWMMLIAGVIMKLLGMAVPFVICRNVPVIAGWMEEEIYLVMAYIFIAEGLCSVLFEGIWQIPEMVFGGRFDCILSRPISPLFQVLSYGMGLQGISVALFGAASMNVLLAAMGMFNAATLMLSIFFILCGMVLCMSVYLIGNSLVFWFDSGGRTSVPYAITGVGQFARYPLGIYPKTVQALLLFVIPYAFIGTVPVLILRGEHVLLYSAALTGMSVLFFFLARLVFYRGIRRYESMGM